MSSAEESKPQGQRFAYGTTLLFLVLVGMEVFTQVTGKENWVVHWLLQHHEGLRPWQWFTSLVIFRNLNQAIVNMIFLVPFALTVEKWVGWERLLKMTAACGVITAAVEQIFFLEPTGGRPYFATTAPHLTYILCGAALIIGPGRTLGSFTSLFAEAGMLADLSVIKLAMIFIAGDSLMALTQTEYFSSIYFHWFGLVLGVGLVAFMVSAKIVNCEGEDLLSGLKTAFAPMEYTATDPKNRYSEVAGPKKKKKKKLKQTGLNLREDPAEEVQPVDKSPAKSIEQFKESLAKGEGEVALAALHKIRRLTVDWAPDQGELLQLISLLMKVEDWESTVLLMREVIERFAEASAPVRLQLAKIELEQQHRPRQCQRTLAGIPAGGLSKEEEKVRKDLQERSQGLIDEGHIELGGDNWGGNLT